MKNKIFFIVNPFSGIGKHKIIEKYVDEFLDKNRFIHEIEYTKTPGHAAKLSRHAVENNFDIVVAVGGDGTINEIARPLIGTNCILGIIPAGSGNGLARHLRIPVNLKKALKIINRLKTKKIDIVKVNDKFFISIAGVGFDALVAKKCSGQKQRGFLKYLLIVTAEYFRYRPGKFSLIVDGKNIERKALFISIANSDQFGYNASIAPNACIDDGLVDICIMKKASFLKTLLIVFKLFTKKIAQSNNIEIFKAKQLYVEQKEKIINLDGDPVELGRKLYIKVIPKSLNVIVPAYEEDRFVTIKKA